MRQIPEFCHIEFFPLYLPQSEVEFPETKKE
jgi:hypothetical protein